MEHTITKKRYHDLLECLPPLYIGFLNDVQISHCFACSEAADHSDKSVVLTICYKKDDKYYSQDCEIFTADGKPIFDTYNYHYENGFRAISWTKPPRNL